MAQATAAGSSLLWSDGLDASQPAAPTNLRVDPEPVGLGNLSWKGMCETPTTGFNYAGGQVALRYVNDERRLLMVQRAGSSVTRAVHGDLTELRMPTLASSVAGSKPMTITRRWSNWTWVPTGALVDQLANWWFIGGLWWDADQQVVWYTMWPYYAPGVIMPFLGATRLNDDGTVTKYGPWYYVNSSYLGFRKVCWYFVTIPERFQSALGGRKVALGANTLGASGGSPTHWGPGLTALRLPNLTSTDPVEAGVPLMDYSPGAGGLAHPYYHCRRETDYQSFYGAGTQGGAIPGPVGTDGFWQSSADLAYPAAWIDTQRYTGLLLLGQRTSRDTWYGLAAERNVYDSAGNFLGRTAVSPPDTMAPDQGSTGYHSNGWQSGAWLVRSQHLDEVARGKRKASADGMRPELLGQWHLRWTEVPRPNKRPYVAEEGMVVDTRTNELIWAHGTSILRNCCDIIPSVQVIGLPS